jgi:hypothetical protein
MNPRQFDELPETPFENVFFDRDKDADFLKKIIDSNWENGIVLSVSSPWGNGKSWFISNFHKMLSQQGYHAFIYNVWKNELSQDPFGSFFSEVYSYLKENSKIICDAEQQKKFTNIMHQVLKYSIPVLTRVLIGKAVDIDGLNEIGRQSITSLDGFIGNMLSTNQRQENVIEEYEKMMNGFFDEVSRNHIQDEKDKPLVIFIDELDRCTPAYMLSFLEVLKHFFCVKKVVFVLVIDKDKICESVEHVYGSHIDPRGYLRKFIEFQYCLSKKEERSRNSYEHLTKYIFDKFPQDATKPMFIKFFSSDLIEIFIHYHLSIRDIIRLATTISITFRADDDFMNMASNDSLAMFVILLMKVYDPDVFHAILWQKSASTLTSFIQSHIGGMTKEKLWDIVGEILAIYIFTNVEDFNSFYMQVIPSEKDDRKGIERFVKLKNFTKRFVDIAINIEFDL